MKNRVLIILFFVLLVVAVGCDGWNQPHIMDLQIVGNPTIEWIDGWPHDHVILNDDAKEGIIKIPVYGTGLDIAEFVSFDYTVNGESFSVANKQVYIRSGEEYSIGFIHDAGDYQPRPDPSTVTISNLTYVSLYADNPYRGF
jgi:hypothetical protein